MTNERFKTKKRNLDNQINVKLLTAEKMELQAYCEKMATTQSQVVRRIIQQIIRGKISLSNENSSMV